MWPRDPAAGGVLPNPITAETNQSFYHPENSIDLNAILRTVFGTNMFTTVVSEVFDAKFTIAYKAAYTVTNLTNIPVRYECLKFRVIRDVPAYGDGGTNIGLQNPFNMAAHYYYSTQDRNATDIGVFQTAIHTERNQLTNNPAWYHWYKLVKKDKFTLGPGKMKKHTLSRKAHQMSLLEVYPNIVIAQANPPYVANARRRGDTFIVYKMLSDAADANGASGNIWQDQSTRTTPLSLLAYQCNYTVCRPNTQVKTLFFPLDTLGYKQVPVAADIVVMADDDIKEAPQRFVE